MNLKEMKERYHIHRIDFNKVKPVDIEEVYSEDKLLCPYCGRYTEYSAEDVDEILRGYPFECVECGKHFFAEGEMRLDITCTPIENKVLERFTRKNIELAYEHMDECEKAGLEWSSPYGVVEYETFKRFGEPLYSNMEDK